MSEHFTLTAETRSDVGKGASRRLRRDADKIPAIIYGANKPATSLSLIHKDVVKALQHEAFFSSILGIVIDGKKEKAILKDIQRHPYKPRILHIDFMRISASEKITMHVPLHFIGEEQAAGVKDGGVVAKHMTELEISCLPADLPEHIEVDITNLELDQSIHISAISLPSNVELTHAIEDDAHDHPVVGISIPKVAPEPEEETASAETEEAAAEEGTEESATAEADEQGTDEQAKE